MANNTVFDLDDLLTPAELAARLKVPTSWVYEQTRHRGVIRKADPLPYRKMGRYLRFVWTEVVEWLDRQKGEQ
jgi:Helix-turn-helix domain